MKDRSNENRRLTISAVVGIICACICLISSIVVMVSSSKKETVSVDAKEQAMVYVGDIPISEYKIITHEVLQAGNATKELQELIEGKTGAKLKRGVRGGSNPNTIRVICDKNAESGRVVISQGKIILYGVSADDCVETVREFANMYLGWAFAGESDAHLTKNSGEVHIPNDVLFTDTPWMEEREPIICLWKTNVPRGQYYNTKANLNSEILTYSDDQLYEYVRMMQTCGFTGIQVTDMCSAWAQYSGYEFVHERLRFMADAAHSLGMNFTLWVWGAEFNGYGWKDDSVVYYDYEVSPYSYDCPEAVATFEKYYSIYAELADCSDRVIVHFDDPSNIHDSSEIAYYAKMLKEKFRSVNPTIDFGISDYTDKYDKAVLTETVGTDITIYSGAVTSPDKTLKQFRTDVQNSGASLGVWSWNLCEMEIDQLAEMNVNSSLIQDVYVRTAMDSDDIMIPTYWSEMDSYHLVNIFSLYCAGKLLQVPNLSTEELLLQASIAVVGDEYAEDLYQILTIISDARTGTDWSTFKIGQENYLLTSDSYPAKDLYERSEYYCGRINEMIAADLPKSTMPLPVSVSELLSMIRSHLYQINEYAAFRIAFDDLKESVTNGTVSYSEEELIEKITALSKPIPKYDALVGVWGQPEALAQFKLLQDFCAGQSIEMPIDSLYLYELKQYVYQEICAYQKNSPGKLTYDYINSNLWNWLLGESAIHTIMDALVDDGLLIRESDTSVSLVNWQEY